MTTYYFIGGEDSDFASKVGVTGVSTTATFRRTTYARCALSVGPTGNIADGWYANFSAATSEFWMTGRWYPATGGNTVGGNIVGFRKGSNRKLVLTTNGGFSGTTGVFRVSKENNAGTVTALATSSTLVPCSATGVAQTKLDIYVKYAVAGAVKVYLDGTLIIDYSGDTTTDGDTTLDNFRLGGSQFAATNGTNYWSEVIVADTDTRSMALVTLAPAAAGNTEVWSGAYTDVNETTMNDATLMAGAANGDIAQFTVSNPGAIASSTNVLALAVVARASKGATGVQNVQAMVRTGSTDYASASLSGLTTTLGPVWNVWQTNPNTSAAWAGSDITAAGFNIGLKAVT